MMPSEGAHPASNPIIESSLEDSDSLEDFVDELKAKRKKLTSSKSGAGTVVASGSCKGHADEDL
jgi:hypothetical protein